VDRHDIGALPPPQRRKQTRNTEHVVEMAHASARAGRAF
jgi:hypothetical protein